MPHDLASRIEYSEKYADDTHEYRPVHTPFIRDAICLYGARFDGNISVPLSRSRSNANAPCFRLLSTAPVARALLYAARHVILPKELAKTLNKKRLLTEAEWRGMGVQQSRGWQHYAIHAPEPHILLFRRRLGTNPTTGKVDKKLEAQAKERFRKEYGAK